jgi:pimeloyl-ACP methyl ester carboxylesterase
MNDLQTESPQGDAGCVMAIHCSLGSSRQWSKLRQHLGFHYQWIAPDLVGYGSNPRPSCLPTTLDEEVAALEPQLCRAKGPLHLVGHSYGGAVAFRIATASAYAHRVRSLTLIEPVLPTLLRDNPADRRLHDLFAQLARNVSRDLEDGLLLEAVDKFVSFWNGSAPPETISSNVRLRLIDQIERIAFDFAAVLAEENVMARACALRVPTLLLSGGLSPYLTQRIVGRLGSSIIGAEATHLPAAGHMLPLTHSDTIFPLITRHLARADDLALMSLAASGAF